MTGVSKSHSQNSYHSNLNNRRSNEPYSNDNTSIAEEYHGMSNLSTACFLPPIKVRHQYPIIYASCKIPNKKYRTNFDDVPEIRKAIFHFQTSDSDRKKQFNDISSIFYDSLNVDDYLADEDNVKKPNTSSFINALGIYLPAAKKKKSVKHAQMKIVQHHKLQQSI
jgi:hypothetical protein